MTMSESEKAEIREFLQWFERQPIEEFMANCCNKNLDGLREKDTKRYMDRMWKKWKAERNNDETGAV